MKQALMSLSSLCMVSALCSQLLHSKSHRFALRMALGLEIFRVTLKLLQDGLSIMIG